jgi:DNA-binding NarL/FixJ family response regulator
MEKTTIRIMLADDHKVLLDGLVMMLEEIDNIHVVATAANGQEVLSQMESCKVDVLLMDIQMPVLDGYETAKIISTKFPEVKVLILSMHSERVYIERMYSAGISGYLLKSAGKEEIIEAIERVFDGQSYFSPDVAAAMLKNNSSDKTSITSSELTRREREILGHIASGLTNPEIAEKLYLSVDTIKTHRKNMMRKLDVNNTAGLVKYAMHHGSEGLE